MKGRTNRVYDSLVNANGDDVFTAMYAALDANQKRPAGVQIAAACLMFRLLCERFDIEPQDAFTAVGNTMQHAHYQRRIQLAAAREYLQKEIK